MPSSIDPRAVQSVTPAVATLAADLGVTLQPGTIVNARVLQVLDANLVRIAIANLTLDVPTTQPLLQGPTLQLAVAQTATGLSLTPVGGDTSTRSPAVIVDDIPLAPASIAPPPASTLSPQEAQAVAVATQSAVTKQAGLSPLFADLAAALPSGALPQPVLRAAAQVLGLRLPVSAALQGGDIKAAMQSSGLMMEATLAASPSAVMPDMKSALLVLRQTLATWLSQDTSGARGKAAAPAAALASTAPEVTTSRVAGSQTANAIANAVNSIADNEPAMAAPQNLLAAQILSSASREAAPSTSREMPSQIMPPVRDAPPAAQPIAAPSIAPDAEPSNIARHLISETDGAIARQTLLQIASLPDRVDPQTSRNDPVQPRWNFEIPFVTPHGTAMAQFEVARDGGGVEVEAAQRIWRARFSLHLEPAGPIHAMIAFSGDTTSVKMWAERPATAAQLRANAAQLSQSLDRAALKAGDIVVADGAPARPNVASGHFLNRAT